MHIKIQEDNLISDGEPGEITLNLRESYMDIVYGRNSKYISWLSSANDKTTV